MAETKDTNPKDLVGLTKLPLRLVPPVAMARLAEALANGAEKYGPYNWRSKGVSLSVYLEASLRHTFAYMDGEDYAEDSGVHHLAHAMACLAIVFDAMELDKLKDDRPLPGGFAARAFEWVRPSSEEDA
jgi:hypothetical protein